MSTGARVSARGTQVVGIDANHEPVTKAVSTHRKKNVYPYFKANGFHVRRFTGAKARRSLVASAVSVPSVAYVTGVGHGRFDAFLGDGDLPVFQANQYDPAEARDKIVHFLSCLTARALGPDFLTNGALAFFGYDDNFTFDLNGRSDGLDCASEVDKGLADGLTAKEVYDRAFAAFTTRIDAANAQKKYHLAGTLENNRDHLRVLGQMDARLS